MEEITWKLELELGASALLHFDGVDGSIVFTDEAGNIWTAAGDAQLDTAQKKFGSASLLLDGTDDYVYTLAQREFCFGNGDGTVDLWARLAELPDDLPRILYSQGDINGYVKSYIYTYSGQQYIALDIYYPGGPVGVFYAVETLAINTWYHFAFVKRGSICTIYLNGINVAYTTLAGTWPNFSGPLCVGGGTNLPLNGWIDEFRVTKWARWTNNFTPPEEPGDLLIWIDATDDVSLADGPIEITDGIQSTSLVDLLAAPGSLSFALDNSPANSAHVPGLYSPGHLNCLGGFAKNIRVRYSEYYNYDLSFQGIYWLQKPIPSAGVFGAAVTRCRATDWLGMMVNEPLPTLGVQTSQRGDELITTLLAAITTQPESIDPDTGDSTFPTAFDGDDVEKDTVYSSLGKIVRSEFGRIYLSAE